LQITEILKRRRPIFSLEFFPPKSPEELAALYSTLAEVKSLAPGFISVTYGAGGGTRDKTLEIAERAKSAIGLESAAHITCVGHSKGQIGETLDELASSGIENVLALRGDPPKGESHFVPHPDGFRHASELTSFIHESYPFCIAVAGYPEGHIEAPDRKTDWTHLEEKVRAGADLIITQLFFENSHFFKFEANMRERGVNIPIVPGIMPITNFHQLLRITRFCGASIPDEVIHDLGAIQHDPNAVEHYGIEYAAKQCRGLLAHGVPGIHFYTLNKSKATREIIRTLQSQVPI
jgi:methylenetetrahydrofolate reductase (NADPH)